MVARVKQTALWERRMKLNMRADQVSAFLRSGESLGGAKREKMVDIMDGIIAYRDFINEPIDPAYTRGRVV